MVLGIYGAGGLGREFLDLARAVNAAAETWENVVFIDDDETKQGHAINGARAFTFDAFRARFPSDTAKAVVATGEPKRRQILREKLLAAGYGLQSLVHPAACIGAETEIGAGAVIQFGSFVSCNVKIGENVLIQPNLSVGHDSVLGEDSVLSSCVAVSGACRIGARAYIGVAASVKEGVAIGADSIVGMGSVVFRDIPDGVIALGSPARVMKQNEDGRVFR
jgi:sugar O-acyltransferase (sialic acid O-acetyltransferase NeuD family)